MMYEILLSCMQGRLGLLLVTFVLTDCRERRLLAGGHLRRVQYNEEFGVCMTPWQPHKVRQGHHDFLSLSCNSTGKVHM